MNAARRLAECKQVSPEFKLSYMKGRVLWMNSGQKVFDVLNEVGVPRIDPSNFMVFRSERVDRWQFKKTAENVDNIVRFTAAILKLYYHANVVEASREGITALNRITRFYNWETDPKVKIPANMAISAMNRCSHPIGRSRQFTVEEVQTATPLESNDISIMELRASVNTVNTEGKAPNELLQFLNTANDDGDVGFLEEEAQIESSDPPAGVEADPIVEEPADSANIEMKQEQPFLEPEPPKAGVVAMSEEDEQKMMEVEAQMLDVKDRNVVEKRFKSS